MDSLDFDTLKGQAKLLRDSGDFEAALSVSTKLTKLNPDVWWLYKDMASDMANIGDVSAANFLLERALEKFPNQFWLLYDYALLAYDRGQYQEAERRIGRFLNFFSASGKDELSFYEMAKLYRLCGFIYQKKLLHAISANFFAKALDYEGSAAVSRLDFEWQALYSRVSQNAYSGFNQEIVADPSESTKSDYKVYYINLVGEKERRLQFEERFSRSFLDLHRINAIDGRLLPTNVVNMLARSQHYTLLGTLGCFMSHLSVWEVIVSEGLEHALILEDDAVPQTHFPRNFGELNIPADFDVCFVNKRMEPLCETEEMAKVNSFKTIPAIDALESKAKFLRGPGLDAYFLSQKGAKKLISLVAEDGYGGHVDWRVVSYGISRDDSHRFPVDSPARWFAERCRSVAQLQAYSLFPALVEVDKRVTSSRDTNDNTPLATLTDK